MRQGRYTESARKYAKHLKPDVQRRLSREAREVVCTALLMAAHHINSGEALGVALFYEPEGIEVMRTLVKSLGGPRLPDRTSTTQAWWAYNLEAVAIALLEPKWALHLTQGGHGAWPRD